MVGHVREVRWRHTETSDGASETGVNVLAMMHRGSPETSAHNAVTPDGKQLNARRRTAGSVVAMSRLFISRLPGQVRAEPPHRAVVSNDML
jgi:hypothetical protein